MMQQVQGQQDNIVIYIYIERERDREIERERETDAKLQVGSYHLPAPSAIFVAPTLA